MSDSSRIACNAEFEALVSLHGQMDDKDHLEGSLVSLYKAPTRKESSEKNVGFFEANRYADAKKHVRNIIAKQVGDARANKIMENVLGSDQRRDGWRRFWKPNRTAISKGHLNDLINQTKQARQTYDPTIAKLSMQKRHQLIDHFDGESNKDKDLAELMQNKDANRMIRSTAKKNGKSHQMEFLDAVENFENHVDQEKANARGLAGLHKHGFPDSNPTPDIPKLVSEAKAIRNRFLDGNDRSVVNTYSDAFASINETLAQDSKDLTFDDLESLFDQTRASVSIRLKDEVVPLLVKDLKTSDTQYGKVLAYKGIPTGEEMKAPAEGTLNLLSKLTQQDSNNVHIRFKDGFMYLKDNHPGILNPSWYNRNHAQAQMSTQRSSKFSAAKRSVRGLVFQLLQDKGWNRRTAIDMKRNIMEPYMASSAALSGTDFSNIVNKVKKLESLRKEMKDNIADFDKSSRESSLRSHDSQLTFRRCATVHKAGATSAETYSLEENRMYEITKEYLELRGNSDMEAYKDLMKLEEELKPILELSSNRNKDEEDWYFPEQNEDGSAFSYLNAPDSDYAKAQLTAERVYDTWEDYSVDNTLADLLLEFTDHPQDMSHQDLENLAGLIKERQSYMENGVLETHFQEFVKNCTPTESEQLMR